MYFVKTVALKFYTVEFYAVEFYACNTKTEWNFFFVATVLLDFNHFISRAKRARHSQVCSIENRGYILYIMVRANFVLITRKEGGA